MVKHEPETHNWLVRLVRTARADSLRTAEVLRPAPRPEAKGAQASDLHTSTVGPVGLDPTTCGLDIPDSRSTRHAPRGSSGGYDADRDPLSSANVPAKTSGGPRRARTDDLRIKSAAQHMPLGDAEGLLSTVDRATMTLGPVCSLQRSAVWLPILLPSLVPSQSLEGDGRSAPTCRQVARQLFTWVRRGPSLSTGS